MTKKKRLLRGDGWSFEPAEEKSAEVASLPPAEQTIRVGTEKRAKGKVVTVASGFVLSAPDLKSLCKKVKSACGGGGTVQESAFEVQGEHVDAVRAFLSKEGYRL